MNTTDQLEIQHISDLHIFTDDSFGRLTVLGALAERLKEDPKTVLENFSIWAVR